MSTTESKHLGQALQKQDTHTLIETISGNQLVYRKSHLRKLEKEYQQAGGKINNSTTEQLKALENDRTEEKDVVSALGISTSMGRLKCGKLQRYTKVNETGL